MVYWAPPPMFVTATSEPATAVSKEDISAELTGGLVAVKVLQVCIQAGSAQPDLAHHVEDRPSRSSRSCSSPSTKNDCFIASLAEVAPAVYDSEVGSQSQF